MTLRPPPYGFGRMQFLADLDAIRDELSRGITLRACYLKRAKKLGIQYAGFTKLVARYAADSRPAVAQHKRDLAQNDRPRRQADAPKQGHTGPADAAIIRRLIKGS